MKQKLLLALLALFTLGGSNLFAQTWSASELTDGKYVFLNVGSGRYLGPGNSWGTQASLIECSHYNTLAKVSDGVYTIESQVNNGGTAYYFSGTYMDGAAVNVTIQDNGEGIFTMSTDGSYYGYDGSTTVLANNLTDPTDANAQWKIMAYDEVYANASEENPVDLTYMILDSNFDRNNRYGGGDNNDLGNKWVMDANNQNLCGGTNENKCAESWCSAFTLSQNITVPNGYFKLRAQAALTEYTVTGADFPVVYATSGANTVTSPFNTMVNGESSMTTMSTQFTNGNYWTNYTDVITVSNKSLTIGVKGTRTDTWCIWDNFQLIYMGPIDLTEFANQLAAAVAAAEATEGTIPTAAYNAIAAVVEENNKTYEDEEGYSTAITTINNAVSTYASSEIVAAYSNYKAIKNAVLAINSSIDTSAADELAEAATTANQTEAIATVRSALKDYLTNNSAENVDVTAALVTNPGFELGNVNGWTNSGAQSAAAQGNKQFDNTQGNYYAERWHADGTVDLNQTVSGLAAGVYEIGAYLYTDTKDGKLYANDINTTFSTSKWYSVQVAVDADGEITFGASCTLTSSTWICMDGFKLTYVGGLPDVTAVTGKMNAEVAAAQTNAIETYNTNRTTANYNAAVAAIAAAQVSVDAYSVAATAVAKAKAIKENHNLASAEAAATFAEAIAGIENPYNEGTLPDDNARNAGTTLGTGVSGWHGNNNAAAVVYLRDGYSLGDFEADPALHVNTWSTEGDNDGSGFSVPFYESWTPNSNSLATNTWTGSLSNLPTGLYKVSAWVRVQVKDGTTVADATGITMDVNGGTAVDVTEGTQVGETQFQLATYEAEGLVKDGNLTVNFNIAADNNISWLSFQNVKYTKVRDLTEEEMAIVPADLAIDATRTIFKGNTVTLTPTSTTEEATIDGYVTWHSDNTSVATVDANGVVTAVAYGTANITVTSTLNAEATATCAVTVTAPLITEAENLDFAEGPIATAHIRTYAKDVKEGENSGMQEVTGWTFGIENGDARAAGVMAYGSSYGMGSDASTFYAPATNPNGEATGNALGMVGVWDGNVQYVQNVKFNKGAYVLTIPVYRNGGATALDKNLIGVILDNGTEYLATTKAYTDNSWTTETIKFTINEDNTYGQLSIGLDAPNKGSADSQRLWIDGVNVAFEPFATTEEIAALNTAIAAAEEHALGFDKDDYAPYNNVAALKALAAAKALDTENPIGQSQVTDATAALTSATWTANTEEVNAIYDGTFANAEHNGAPAGWTMSNNTLGGDYHSRAFNPDERLAEFNETKSGFFIRFDGNNSNRGSMYFYGRTTGYTMPLKANTTYYVKADFAGWGSTGKPLRMNVTGPEEFSAVGQTQTTTVQADNADDTPQQFLIVFTTADAGNYEINFQTPGADTNTHNVLVSNIELFKAQPVDITIKAGRQYTAFSSNMPLDFTGSELSAQIVISATGITKTVTKVPANTGIIVGLAEATTEAKTISVPVCAGETDDVTGNMLVAVPEATTIPQTVDGYTNYVFGKSGGKEQFFKVRAAGMTVPANNAYLAIPEAQAKGIDEIGLNGDATGISTIENADMQNGEVYNLQGQKVNRAQKGVYIVNGKKVILK